MESLTNERIIVAITDELVQEEAETVLKRRLTAEELEKLEDEIFDSLVPAIQDAIYYMLKYPDSVKETEKPRAMVAAPAASPVLEVKN